MKKFFTPLVTLLAGCWAITSVAQIPLEAERIVLSNERRINSEELEYSPIFYKDGIVFVTTRSEGLLYDVLRDSRAGTNMMKMFWSQRDEEGFLKEPELFSPELLTKYHEGPMTFDREATTIFFTRNELSEYASDKLKKMQVYSAKQDSLGRWAKPEKLPFNNVEFNFMHPTINANGDMLYLASDVPGGQGGMDIYMVTKVGDTWGQMVNLGPSVNTPGNEVFPYIAADGALYFSSDGHSGLGGLDLYMTYQRNQKWEEPENMGDPFNSPSDDFGFIVDNENKNGYYSSDRGGGAGADDIYSFYIAGSLSPYAQASKNTDKLVIKDADGNPMDGVTISAINLNEVGDPNLAKLLPGEGPDNFILDVNSEGLGESGVTGANGTASVPLRKGSHVIKIQKEGYLPEYVVVTPETDLSTIDVKMRKASNCLPLDGQVLLQGSSGPVKGAEVHIVDVESKEAVVVYSDNDGFFEYCLSCNRTYSIYAVKGGAVTAPSIISSKEVRCVAGERTSVTLYLGGGGAFYAGMTIELPNIYFNFDDASLRPDAYPELNEVVAMLTAYPGMKLELASHTDSRGGSAYNLDLSRRRSASVLSYLTSKGVDGNRLVPRGYGETQLRNRCTNGVACSEAQHQNNRRTEVKILELGDPNIQASSKDVPIADADSSPSANSGSEPTGEPDAGKGGEETSPSGEVVPISNSGNAGAESNKGNSSRAKSFTVVAGTFANQDNANRRHSLLTGMGYDKTSIVKQTRNGLYAVYVETFDSKSGAFDLVKKLAGQQLNAYVLKQ